MIYYRQSVLERVLPLLEPNTFVEIVPENIADSMGIPTPWVLRVLKALVVDDTLELRQAGGGHPRYRPGTKDAGVVELMRGKGGRSAEQQRATTRP